MPTKHTCKKCATQRLTAPPQASDLGKDWYNVGTTRPVDGKAIQNDGLASLLRKNNILTFAQWNILNLGKVTKKSFIKSGDAYFMPMPLGLQLVRDKIAQQRMLRLLLDKRSKFHQLPDQVLEIIFRLTVECPEQTSGF